MEPSDEQAINERLKKLSPRERAFLERRLIDKAAAVARENAIARRTLTSPAPLSYSQELLWLLSEVFHDGVAYNAPLAFRLDGALHVDALRDALNALVERHEILRTTYRVLGDRPMQVIADHTLVDLRLIDLVGKARGEQEAEVQGILHEESEAAFDLVNGPIMRPTLIRLGRDEHVFLTVLHHIATDGYSRAIFLSDLTDLYEALVRKVPSQLEPLAIQYADFAVWHRNWLERGTIDKQLSFWKQKLAGVPARLDLPADFSRPPVRSYLGDHESLMLELPIREGLRTVARKSDATLFVTLVAVFAALLHRYSGQDDLVIGTPFAGRNRTEFESMMGYFINPLALRVDVSGDPTFDELVQRVRETTMAAIANADVPYEMVVRATNPERDLSQTPIFQAMLVLHNPDWVTRRPTFEPEGIRATEIAHKKGWSKFDVLLGIAERTSGLNTTWEYSTELFMPATVRRMMEHFRTLAINAANGPERPLSKLSMLSDAERTQLLVTWDAPGVPLPERDSIKELFEEQAAQTPDATAVVFEDERMTFDELNRRANRLAGLLHTHGVVPGTLVGIMLEKSLQLVAAVLAVMKTGAAYVPLDPLYPKERLEFMLADAQPRVLLTDRELVRTVPTTEATMLTVDSCLLDDLGEENPPTTAGGHDLAYVIYTSGSTGLPKAVMIENRSLASAYFAYERAYRLHELRCHLQVANVSFDVFTGDLIRSLLVGAKLVLCPLEILIDPPRLYELMVQEGVDAAEFVPATATLLFEYAEREGRSLDFMRLIAIGGEAWRNEKYLFFKRFCGPQTRLINSYGLTEATMDSTWFEAPPDAELLPGRFVPLGAPFANTRIYVLDTSLEPTPIGIPGELCVGGVAVGRGYLNRPELTAQRFVSDPFSDAPDAVLYRTGDLARRQPDGSLEFIGRSDRQLKIRGFRIEPGEIEAVLERHPDVQGAAVSARVDNSGDLRLVAYVKPANPGRAPVADELRAFIAEHVPAYMVPSSWVVVDAPPLTPNGKIDVDALPAPEWDRSAAGEFVAPRTETERLLATIWSDVLAVENVGVTDNFFALGGHSLLAVRLFAQIEQLFKRKLPMTTLFRGATVEQLAAAIQCEFEEPPKSWTIVPVRPEGRRPPLYIIGGIDGEVTDYPDLVNALDPQQPVYALQPAGLDGRAVPKTTVEEIAADYVRDLLAFQPEGAYLIAGYCYAGQVAYEVARQLHELGAPAAMLALIDAGPGRARPSRFELERQKLEAFLESDLRGKGAWIARRGRGFKRKIAKRLRWLAYDLFLRLGLPMPGLLRDVHEAGYRAWAHYESQPAPIKLTLFPAVEIERDWIGPTLLWTHLATGGVEVVPLHGSGIRHDNLMKEPYVHALADGLGKSIEKALAEVPALPDRWTRA